MNFTILMGECPKDQSTKLAILKQGNPIVTKSGSPNEMAQVLADNVEKHQLGSKQIDYKDGQYWSQSQNKQKTCDKVVPETKTLFKRTISRVHSHNLN